MSQHNSIHNIDSLEKEIYRLKLDLERTKKCIGGQWDYLSTHGSSLFKKPFSCSNKAKQKEEEKNGKHSFFSEKLNTLSGKIIDNITERAAQRMDRMFEKFFDSFKSSK